MNVKYMFPILSWECNAIYWDFFFFLKKQPSTQVQDLEKAIPVLVVIRVYD